MAQTAHQHAPLRAILFALLAIVSLAVGACGSAEQTTTNPLESSSDDGDVPEAGDLADGPVGVETESPDEPETTTLPTNGETQPTVPDGSDGVDIEPPPPIDEPADLDEPEHDDAVVDAPDAVVVDPEPAPEGELPPTSGSAALDGLLGDFGVDDPVAAGQCVRDEVEADELDFDEFVMSDAAIVAVIRCERDAVRRNLEPMMTDRVGVAEGVDGNAIECVLDGLLDWTGALLLGDAEAQLAVTDIPPDLSEILQAGCNLSSDQLDAIFE